MSTSGHGGARLVRHARPHPGWKPNPGPVPILGYHALAKHRRARNTPGSLSDPEFEEGMSWLHTNGYEAVALDQAESAWYHGGTLPAKMIVFTFGNGYPEQMTFAPRVMFRYGWPGVLFEITEEHLRRSESGRSSRSAGRPTRTRQSIPTLPS
jgi:hypothetical protein